MKTLINLILIGVFPFLLLTACGQKGDLYLPDTPPAAEKPKKSKD